jgi:predicted unusual protein kinase regulating ubiquinone biosynthesis (AarF/ABC1/UbiB family)
MKRIMNLKNTALKRSTFAIKTASKVLPSIIQRNIEPDVLLTKLLGKDIDKFVDDVGSLKGSFLKAAQLLSSYGEYYFPPEVNMVLNKVQSQSHYLDWDKIKEFIPIGIKENFDIEKEPLAAASIGQVHIATNKKDKKKYALKIQYPGVKKAIDLDIKILKSFLSLMKLLPKDLILDDVFNAIKIVLKEEMDYEKEVEKHMTHYQQLIDFQGVKVPLVDQLYSCENCIVSEYIPAKTLSDIDLESMTQKEKNIIGHRLMELYFYEVFHCDYIQSDCHAGNFLWDGENLILIDFGAMVKLSPENISIYQNLITSLYRKDQNYFFSLLDSFNKEHQNGLQFDMEKLWEYCQLAISPLRSHHYDWGSTDLPDRLVEMAKNMLSDIDIQKPPHQFIFLDRKLVGIFSLLNKFNCRLDMQSIAIKYLE